MTELTHTAETAADLSHAAPDGGPLRLLAVHAHPDDESSKGSATMAYYLSQGAQVMVVSCTGGEEGGIQNPHLEQRAHATRDMGGARRPEMAKAQEVLGIEHRWLGYMDSGLPEGDPLPELPFGRFATLEVPLAAAPLIRLVRDFRPHVIVGYDAFGGYGHPDHVMAHKLAVEAYQRSGDSSAYPDAGPAWEVSKLYYDVGFNTERFAAMHEALESRGLESPFAEWLARVQEWSLDSSETTGRAGASDVTTQVRSGDFFEYRTAALKAHATQVDPQGFFFAVTDDFQREVWPWEDFVLAQSRVSSNLPESSLFAGIGSVPA